MRHVQSPVLRLRYSFVLLFLAITLGFTAVAGTETVSAQVRCSPTGGSCPQEYDGCSTCTGGYSTRYKNFRRYNCTDGSYYCEFTSYSYSGCGTCFN